MKRCPTCNKTFTDPNLSYCIDDGTPLASIPEPEDETTQVGSSSASTGWAPPPPPSYQPPAYTAPAERKRRTWPWLLAVIGVLVLALVGLSVAAVLLIPRIVKRSSPVIVSKTNANNQDNTTNDNTSSSADKDTDETNSNTNASVNSPPPTDKELVLGQLTNLEHEWTVANLNADKRKLREILADDYVGTDAQGKMLGKSEYLATVQRDASVQKWEFEDLKLTLRGDRATLAGKIHFHIDDNEKVYNFVDRFVWREGRWQATGSEVTPTQ